MRFFLNAYYRLKPVLPLALRILLRRQRAKRILNTCGGRWPILESAAHPPKGWCGWPEGKAFALILTHDVEGPSGLNRSQAVAELEIQQGVRSSFNFVPEGDYETPRQLREFLTASGFEVGVHDLNHDGFLYWSRRGFQRNAGKINAYLKAWDACGFRSGFMMHQLEWLHELEILYDASTFDTDPFEPQSDGAGTIFPFWVPGPAGKGYVELPYTLVQDITLFTILEATSIDIWKRKVEWIARKQGMVLVNVHPDYAALDGQPPGCNEYPIHFYQEFLEWIKRQYEGQYWNALPKEVASLAAKCLAPSALVPPSSLLECESS